MEIVNTKLLQEEACEGVVVEDSLPQRRARIRKRMDGESAPDENSNWDENKKFEVTVYNSIYNTTLQSLEKRFAGDQKLYKDLLLLCPSRFLEIRKEKTNISLDGLMNVFGIMCPSPSP